MAPWQPMTDARTTFFLVNPASDNGATGRRWPELAHRAERLGLSGETLFSERPGHLIELAREAVDRGAKLVVAVGGDGTLNETVNGVAGRDVDLATIPLGTGMDFVRTYRIPTRFDDAVRVALEGTPRTIDAGRVRYRTWGGEEAERWFANVGSVGMSGAVAQRTNGMSKALGGKATFFYALTRVFLEWENTEVTVAFDEGERRGRMHDVIVANGVWHGGGMMLAPDARPDDGRFDIVLIGDVSKLDFLTTAPKIYKGRHVTHPKVEVVRSARVAVDAGERLPIELEGEQVGTTPAVFEVVPGALRVRAPVA
ncbi:MAG TPA: diacylglycerol kinase family protein [Gaiellaceae bacterium]|nr:diacylglycerol kinase family protein [Gaiellaceae bacterium]